MTRTIRLRIVLFSLILSFTGSTLADTMPTTPALRTLDTIAAPTTYSGFTFSGYIEPSYNYLLRSNHFTSGVYDREFDLEPKGFTLQQAAITIAKQPPQGFGGLLNLVLGRDANSLAPAGMNPNYFGIQNLGLTPTQAYLQYTLYSFTLLGGKYNSLMGEENYNPTTDSNFSRSFSDHYAEPGTFIGIEGNYVVSNKLSITADVNNGWDTIQYTSRQKSIEVGFFYKSHATVDLTAIGITGIQPITDGASFGPTGRRNALNFVGSWKATDKLILTANYDYGMQTKAALPDGQAGKAFWQGLAAYLDYHYNDKWETALRGEIFSDQNGYRTGVKQSLKEVTLTVAYSILKCLLIRAETRHDFSNAKAFVTINGRAANHNQQSFALEGLYKF